MGKRSRELKPLTSEHEQALLLAFQIKKGIAGTPEAAGAPRDVAGLLALAKRYETSILSTHTRAEEELLSRHLAPDDVARLAAEHAEMRALLANARSTDGADLRNALLRFADLVERHVRWEERELFPACEAAIGEAALEALGQEIEIRLAVARAEERAAAKRAS
ncbi:MAG TPA: hemerythrin domain-containing protein [Anaeromyxobacteraceae bacterium]|nr:hemerythrin domain-containing protein [Anaeromyxobacteraceae bacterium]